MLTPAQQGELTCWLWFACHELLPVCVPDACAAVAITITPPPSPPKQPQAEAEAADAAERRRLQALAEEVRQFNDLKLMQLTEQERQERWVSRAVGKLCAPDNCQCTC